MKDFGRTVWGMSGIRKCTSFGGFAVPGSFEGHLKDANLKDRTKKIGSDIVYTVHGNSGSKRLSE